MKITPISGIPSSSRTYCRDKHKLFEVIDDFRLSNAEFAEIIFDDCRPFQENSSIRKVILKVHNDEKFGSSVYLNQITEG